MSEHCYAGVTAERDRVQQTRPRVPMLWPEQSAWRRLVRGAPQHGWREDLFEPHGVQSLPQPDKDWELYRERFFHDPACTMLSVLDT